MADRTIRTVLTLDPSQFESGAQRARKAAEGIGTAAKQTGDQSQSAMQRMVRSARDNRQAWTEVGGALTIAGGAVTGLMAVVAKTGIEYNSLRQTATASLTSVTGSIEAANAQMARLDEFGQNSWLMRDVLVRAQQNMAGFGIETGKVVPYMEALAEAVAGTTGSQQNFEELARLMGQVESQGRLTAETFNQFGLRGIDAAEMIGLAMGKTAGQIRDEVTAGTLDATVALDALAEGMMATYEGSSDLIRNTFRGAVDDVAAAFRDLSAIAMAPFVDPEGGGLLVSLLNQASDLLFMLRDELPDGVIQAGGILTSLGGMAALAGGGFALLFPRVVSVVDSLVDLGVVSPGVLDRVRDFGPVAGRVAVNVGKLAVALGAAFAAMHAARAIADGITGLGDAVPTVDLLTSRLEHLSSELTGFDAILGDLNLRNFQNLADSAHDLANLSGFDKFVHDLGLSATRSDEAAEAYANAGQALAIMAERDLALAQEKFNDLWVEAGATEQAAQDLLEVMPAWRDHLEQVALAAGLGADESTILQLAVGFLSGELEEGAGAAEGAASGIREYEGALQSAADAQAEARAKLDEWIDSMGQAAASFGGVIDGYNAAAEAADSSTASMEDWIGEMQKQAEAVANWRENTLTASAQIREDLPEDMQAAGRAMVDEMVLAGDEGAQALQTFVGGAPEQRRQLIEAWQGTGYDIGVGLANEMTSAPDGEVGANTFPAEQALAAFLGAVYNSEEDVIIDGNPVPAEAVLAAVRHAILTTDEPVTIDGNDVPANDVLNALMTAIRNEEEDVTIDGNRVPADQVVTELMTWVSMQGASVQVDANVAEAERNIQALMSRWDGATITTYNRLVQTGAGGWGSSPHSSREYASGGAIEGYASGGLLRGPGTGTSDSILATAGPSRRPIHLSNGEFVQQAAAVQHYGVDTMYALNRRQIPREALHQFAGGGSPQHVTQYLPAPRSTATPQRVSLDGVRIRGRLDLGDGLSGVIDGRIEERERQNRTFGGRP